MDSPYERMVRDSYNPRMATHKIYLGFDLGGHVGVCVHRDNRVETHEWDIRPPAALSKTLNNQGIGRERIYRFLNSLNNLIVQMTPRNRIPMEIKAWYELPYMEHKHAMKVLAPLEGVLLAWCYSKEIPCTYVVPQAMRKACLGRGSGSKDDLRRVTGQWAGRTFSKKEQHIADACAVVIAGLGS
jgi:Holliday junction resolvasome RuvABC endonuclease subunit